MPTAHNQELLARERFRQSLPHSMSSIHRHRSRVDRPASNLRRTSCSHYISVHRDRSRRTTDRARFGNSSQSSAVPKNIHYPDVMEKDDNYHHSSASRNSSTDSYHSNRPLSCNRNSDFNEVREDESEKRYIFDEDDNVLVNENIDLESITAQSGQCSLNPDENLCESPIDDHNNLTLEESSDDEQFHMRRCELDTRITICGNPTF